MEAISPEVNFVRALSRFKKRKKNSPSYVHVAHKTSREEVFTSYSRSERQRNVLTSVMHVQSCCFAHKPIAFGPFRCRLRRGCYDVGDSADDYGHDISHSKD